MKENIDFCRKLFKKLIASGNSTNDVVDYFISLDYYTLKVLELLEHWNVDRANKYIVLFKEFQAELKMSKHPKALEMEVFFFALNNVLTDRNAFVESDERNDYIKDYVKNLMEIIQT